MKQSLRGIGLAAVAMVLGAALVGSQLVAQAPGGPGAGGRGGGGGRGGMMFNPARMADQVVQGSWSFIAFEIDIEDAKLIELRPTFKKAWLDAKNVSKEFEGVSQEQMREKMQAVMPVIQESQKQLRESIKAKLNAEQGAKLDAWYEQQAAMMRGPGGGGPGGPGGRGGEGGGRPPAGGDGGPRR